MIARRKAAHATTRHRRNQSTHGLRHEIGANQIPCASNSQCADNRVAIVNGVLDSSRVHDASDPHVDLHPVRDLLGASDQSGDVMAAFQGLL